MTPFAHILVGPSDTPPDGYVPTNLIAPSKTGEERRVWVSTSVVTHVDHIIAMTGMTRGDDTLEALITQITLVHGVSRKTLLDTSRRPKSVTAARRQLIVQAWARRQFDGRRVYETYAALGRALGIDSATIRHALRYQVLYQRKQPLMAAE